MGFGEKQVTRIDQVRRALAEVVPEVAPKRNLGLVVFGPGSKHECDNIELRLRPAPNSAQRIMAEIQHLQPYGQTPLTAAVALGAEALDFREQPGVIVLLTDGAETCGGDPCALADELKSHGSVVHVIGFLLRETSEMSGTQVVRCLTERTGGMFISTENADELVVALRKTLSCPFLSWRGG